MNLLQTRRLVAFTILLLVAFALVPARSHAEGESDLQLVVDKRDLHVALPVAGEPEMVPLRPLADALGIEISGWVTLTRAATVRGFYRTGTVQADNRWMSTSTGGTVELPTAPRLRDGRLWVPAVAFLQALGYDARREDDRLVVGFDRTVQVSTFLTKPGIEVTYTAAIGENNWTVISGRFDPSLQVYAVQFANPANLTVPVGPDGRFEARTPLPAGKTTSLLLSAMTPGNTLSPGFLVVTTPPFLAPTLPAGEGIEVRAQTIRPGVVTVTSRTTMDGELVLELRPQGAHRDLMVWTYGLYKQSGMADMRTLPVAAGMATTTLRLPGPALYQIRVSLTDAKGVYREAVALTVLQHEPVAVDNGGINVNLAPKLAEIPSGTFADFVPIAGTTAKAEDGFIFAWVTYQTGPGPFGVEGQAVTYRQRIPVVQGKFSAKVWLRFGAGEYQVHLAHPISRMEQAWDEAFRLRGTGTDQLRYLTPSTAIEADDPQIVALARELTADVSDPMARTKKIYNWVTGNIAYDTDQQAQASQRIGDGALRVLETRRATCYGYAKLTVALLRAAGVEARSVSGTAGRQPPFVGHAWAEARVAGRWVTLDPTWDAALIEDGKVISPARSYYFDPDPAFFAREHQFEKYDD